MNRLAKRVYIFFAILLVVILIVVQVQLKKSSSVIRKEIEKEVLLSSNMMQREVEGWINQTHMVIEEVGRTMTYQSLERDEFSTYLASVGRAYPEFLGVYFGAPDGTFIISHDWVPPDTFDLTNRPWYKDAMAAKGMIITDPFVDAMTGDLILTFAKPVWNQSSDIIGVVAGDITLETLQEKFSEYAELTQSEFVLIDGKEESDYTTMVASQSAIEDKEFYAWYIESVEGYTKKDEVLKVSNNGLDGFFHYQHIAGTDWMMMNFSPINAFSQTVYQVEWLSLLVYVMLLIFITVMYHIQKKFIVQPLLTLGDHISNINVVADPSYRLTEKDHLLFGPLVKKINWVLGHVDENLKEVQRQKMNFEALFLNNHNAVAMVDEHHNVKSVNAAFESLFGYALDEIFGVNLDDVVTNNIDRDEAIAYTKQMFQGIEVNTEGIRYGKNNEAIDVRIQGVPMTHHGYMVGGFGIYTDIRRIKEEERYRMYMSSHDDLTGLYNRTYCNEKLAEYQKMGNVPLSIIFLDVNGLKLINDAFGPATGDKVLSQTANRLKETCDENCFIGRYGGDEFIILSPNLTQTQTSLLAKKMKLACHEISIGDIQISVSVGWAMKTTGHGDVLALLRNAEDDLYKHKIMESNSVKGKTIYTILNTLHETNNREEEHSQRVSLLSEEFGYTLRLTDREINALRSMSLLHDVGKIAIDENILNKEGPLTDLEYKEMKRHPEIGYRILSAVPELSEIAEYVLAHHERWDGHGYPRGLKGEEIPRMARIISIVDAFDAMTSDRPYRKARDIEWALAQLKENAGTQFDPKLVDIFITLQENR